MRKYRFKGADAEAMLDRMVTRDVSAQAVDTVAYNVWCTDAGRVVDDGTLFRLAHDEFMVCCADPCFDWFQLAAIGFERWRSAISAMMWRLSPCRGPPPAHC